MVKPYIREIDINSYDSHQTSPGILLTFLRWENRDTANYNIDNMATRQPMVVYSDVINCVTTTGKQALTPSVSLTLKGGDINYSTALSPGDFVLVNLVNFDSDVSNSSKTESSTCLRNRAVNLKPINEYNDGFKGVFKIQTVRKQITTNPFTGVNMVTYAVHGFGFTEFNNSIYYDPVVYGNLNGKYALFMAQFNKFWSNIVASKQNKNIQEILELLIRTLVGEGVGQNLSKLQPKPNNHFKIPANLGPLLGKKNAKYACELYDYIFGIWKGSGTGSTPWAGFNPNITKSASAGFYKTNIPLDGRKIIEPEYWNNIKAWAIIQKYLNNVINEMYTTYRVNPDGKVTPMIIARQKPFSSLHYSTGTKHLEIPRWKISPNLINSMDLGKDEAARINFVQIYTRSLAANDERNKALQVGTGNWRADTKDIVRNGLRPYLATANFDFPIDGNKLTKGNYWAGLVSDWLFAGHLREGGTINCKGIQEPISIGDNLELNDVVYHIDQVSHVYSISPNGEKSFSTRLTVSFGTDVRSSKKMPVYPEMQFTDYQSAVEDDWNHDRLLPGWSDTQDIVGRDNGEETQRTKEKDFTPGSPSRPTYDGDNSGENKKPK